MEKSGETSTFKTVDAARRSGAASQKRQDQEVLPVKAKSGINKYF